MASVFDTIKQAAGQGNKSLNWYRNTVNRLVGKTSATQLFVKCAEFGNAAESWRNIEEIYKSLSNAYPWNAQN